MRAAGARAVVVEGVGGRRVRDGQGVGWVGAGTDLHYTMRGGVRSDHMLFVIRNRIYRDMYTLKSYLFRYFLKGYISDFYK